MPGIAIDIDDTICESALAVARMMVARIPAAEGSTAEDLIREFDQPVNVPSWRTQEAMYWLKMYYESPEYMEKFLPVAGAVEALKEIEKIMPVAMYITSRMTPMRQVTETWLEKYGFPKAQVVMRSEAMRNPAWKFEYFKQKGLTIDFMIDDNVAAWTAYGDEFVGKYVWFNRYMRPVMDDRVVSVSSWEEIKKLILGTQIV